METHFGEQKHIEKISLEKKLYDNLDGRELGENLG